MGGPSRPVPAVDAVDLVDRHCHVADDGVDDRSRKPTVRRSSCREPYQDRSTPSAASTVTGYRPELVCMLLLQRSWVIGSGRRRNSWGVSWRLCAREPIGVDLGGVALPGRRADFVQVKTGLARPALAAGPAGPRPHRTGAVCQPHLLGRLGAGPRRYGSTVDGGQHCSHGGCPHGLGIGSVSWVLAAAGPPGGSRVELRKSSAHRTDLHGQVNRQRPQRPGTSAGVCARQNCAPTTHPTRNSTPGGGSSDGRTVPLGPAVNGALTPSSCDRRSPVRAPSTSPATGTARRSPRGQKTAAPSRSTRHRRFLAASGGESQQGRLGTMS